MTKQERIVTIDELPAFAAEFSAAFKNGDRVCLVGEMGAGKTTFLFHVARAFGIGPDAGFSSPTFTILNRYETETLTLNHVDLYRLNSYSEFEALDLIPFLEEKNSVTFVEWGGKFPELADFFTVTMRFESVPGNADARRISWERP